MNKIQDLIRKFITYTQIVLPILAMANKLLYSQDHHQNIIMGNIK